MNLALSLALLLAAGSASGARTEQEAEIARLEKELGPLASIQAIHRELSTRVSQLDALEAARGEGIAQILEQIAGAMPENVKLKSLSWRRGESWTFALTRPDPASMQTLVDALAAAKICKSPRIIDLTVVCGWARPNIAYAFRPEPAVRDPHAAEERLAQLTAIAQNKPQSTRELATLRENLAYCREKVPDSDGVEEMKDEVARAMEGYPYQFDSREADKVAAGFVEAIPLRWRFTGPYNAAGAMLDALAKLPRFTSFVALRMENPRLTGDEIFVNTTVELEIYRFRADLAKASEPLKPPPKPAPSTYVFRKGERDPFR